MWANTDDELDSESDSEDETAYDGHTQDILQPNECSVCGDCGCLEEIELAYFDSDIEEDDKLGVILYADNSKVKSNVDGSDGQRLILFPSILSPSTP